MMEIVQLSDIHFGAQFREDVFAKVIDEVNSLSPDAVIITGDLTNEGLKEEYEQCKELISKINVEKIIAVSGNHDYSCLLYTSPSPRDGLLSRMPSSA